MMQGKRTRQTRLTRKARHDQGSTIVEFAFVTTLLLTGLLTIVDFGQLFYSNLTMQHAVREGTRFAVTGSTALAATPAAADARCQAAIAKIREQSLGTFDRVAAEVAFKTVAPDGSTTDVANGSCYNASEIIVIEVQSTAQIITPFLRPFFNNGEYQFTVATTMKNEAFQ
ncbi:MAG: TadE/TadG family type IV pilus assembly protein [Burkholderiaceae bacterium]